MARTIFNDFAQIKEIVGTVQKNMAMATLEGYILQAQEHYILPVLGRPLLQALVIGVNSDNLTAAYGDLLAYVQRPLAFYALVAAAPTLMVQTGDRGIVEGLSDEAAPTRQWVMRDLVESWLQSADLFTDMLLEFLEENAQAYPEWASSDAYTVLNSTIVRSAAHLSRYVNVQGSRRTFLALRPYLLRAQELHLPEVLGEALYAELTQALADGQPGTSMEGLAKACMPFVAHAAMVEALPEITVQISGSGIKVLQSSDGINSRLQASDTAISALQAKHQRLADTYRVALIKYLESYADLYPSYVPAAAGTSPYLTRLPDNSDASAKSFLI